jgi:hypothetical protein
MPKVLSEDLREAGAVAILEFARSKYPEYSDAQLSSLFKRASRKVKTKRAAKISQTVVTQ